MQAREWTFIDKSAWGKGAWEAEPDKAQWQDEKTGLPCLAVRNPHAGNWCGYVGVAEGHPLFDKHYDSVETDLDVHGGITFSDRCAGNPEGHTICHVVGEGEPEVFWFGFDCAHLFDLSPAMRMRERGMGRPDEPADEYRTLAYVKAECASLALQLASAGSGEH